VLSLREANPPRGPHGETLAPLDQPAEGWAITVELCGDCHALVRMDQLRAALIAQAQGRLAARRPA
jgi:hypothetical protein